MKADYEQSYSISGLDYRLNMQAHVMSLAIMLAYLGEEWVVRLQDESQEAGPSLCGVGHEH